MSVTSIKLAWPALAGVLLLGGCTTVPPEAGFPDVRQAVADRTGQRIQWGPGD